ncbi:hypothetical protein ACFQH5_14565 [Halomonas salifodinae]|uniref:Chemotaxis protein CheW n=1 Tax=Halomonas salifodinae TaxID=438745 RepID=A0ABW2F3C6_9GAMM
MGDVLSNSADYLSGLSSLDGRMLLMDIDRLLSSEEVAMVATATQ